MPKTKRKLNRNNAFLCKTKIHEAFPWADPGFLGLGWDGNGLAFDGSALQGLRNNGAH